MNAVKLCSKRLTVYLKSSDTALERGSDSGAGNWPMVSGTKTALSSSRHNFREGLRSAVRLLGLRVLGLGLLSEELSTPTLNWRSRPRFSTIPLWLLLFSSEASMLAGTGRFAQAYSQEN